MLVEPPLEVVTSEVASVGASKRALTVVAAVMVRTQGLVRPAQAPVHPVKVWPGGAVAVKLTELLFANCADAVVQPAPQLIPAGLETTTPWPLPAASLLTVSVESVVAALS